MPPRRSNRPRTTLTSAASPPAPKGRPQRAASSSTVKVTRDESHSPDESKKALRLTMKMPSSKLREATSNPRSRPTSRGNAVNQLTDSLTGGEVVSGPRASRANKKYVVESESDDDEDEDDEDEAQPSEEDQEDEEEGDGEAEDEEDEEQIGGPEESDDEEEEGDEDAEGDVDADGDVEMDDDADDGQPLPSQTPALKIKGPAPTKATPKAASSKPTLTVTPAQADKVKSVEAKEMEMDDDDEELSDLSEDAEDAGEEDAEGDVDEEMGDEEDGSRSPGSRGSTPDVSKMTKRQRSRLDQVMGSDFLQLPMGMWYLRI